MKRFAFFLSIIVLSAPFLAKAQPTNEPLGKFNIAYKWGKLSLTCTGNDTERFRPRPTVTSRFLGLIWTAVFDAWSRYDDKANPVYLRNVNRQFAAERTLRNKEIAISYAAYRTMLQYYYSDSVLLRKTMYELGFDPDNKTLNPNQPAGIGNLAAKYVIEQRLMDGANQTGNVNGTDGKPYADYTGYHPVNSADTLTDLKCWQPNG